MADVVLRSRRREGGPFRYCSHKVGWGDDKDRSLIRDLIGRMNTEFVDATREESDEKGVNVGLRAE